MPVRIRILDILMAQGSPMKVILEIRSRSAFWHGLQSLAGIFSLFVQMAIYKAWEELNSEHANTNPSSGMEGDLNPVPLV